MNTPLLYSHECRHLPSVPLCLSSSTSLWLPCAEPLSTPEPHPGPRSSMACITLRVLSLPAPFSVFYPVIWGSDRTVIMCMFKSLSFKFNREEKEGAREDEKGSRCILQFFKIFVPEPHFFTPAPQNPCITTR